MDGSCNGLQHYAALGRDEAGAKAVNVVPPATPMDLPSDVYTIVLEVVKEKVQRDAEQVRLILRGVSARSMGDLM